MGCKVAQRFAGGKARRTMAATSLQGGAYLSPDGYKTGPRVLAAGTFASGLRRRWGILSDGLGNCHVRFRKFYWGHCSADGVLIFRNFWRTSGASYHLYTNNGQKESHPAAERNESCVNQQAEKECTPFDWCAWAGACWDGRMKIYGQRLGSPPPPPPPRVAGPGAPRSPL